MSNEIEIKDKIVLNHPRIKFEVHTSQDEKTYFTINSSNGEILATSEMYSSYQWKDTIDSIIHNAATALIYDERK